MSIYKKLAKLMEKLTNKRKLKRYYLDVINKDKSYTAFILDGMIIHLIITVAFFIYFYNQTQDFLFSSILTIQFFILYSLIKYKVKSIRLIREIEKTNRKIAKKIIFKDLLNKTPIEFLEEMKDILNSTILEAIEPSIDMNFDFFGIHNGKKVGIKCYQYKGDYKLSVKDVRDFFLRLRQLKIEEGIIVTTSFYEEDVADFIPKLEKYAKIYLIDLDKLVEIIEKSKLYPSEREIEKYILNQLRERKKKFIEYRREALSKGKTSKYFLIGGILNISASLTPYKRYYEIVSYLLFVLGFISLGNYILNILRPCKEQNQRDFI